MSEKITRASKGAALTHAEADGNVKRNTIAKTVNYTVTSVEDREVIQCTNAITITFPDVSTLIAAINTSDFFVDIKNTNSSANVTLARSGTDTFDGSTSVIIYPLQSVRISVNAAGSNWNITASTDQPLKKTNSPTFAGLDITGNLLRVGTNTPAENWTSTWDVIELSKSAAVSSQDNFALYLSENAYNEGSAWKYQSLDNASMLQINSGGFTFNVSGSGAADSAITWTQALDINGAGSVLLTGASGGHKGAGTLNAVAVYDDNVLLTDYVFDLYIDNKINPLEQKQAEKLLGQKEIYDLQTYINSWREHRHLPSMPDRETFNKKGLSIGDLAQKLWETVELLAIHMEQLKNEIDDLKSIVENNISK